MTNNRTVTVTIKVDDQGTASIDKVSDATDNLEKKSSGLGGTLKSVGTIAGGFLVANVVAGGVQKLTGFIGDSIAAVKESIQVNAQLDAVLKSTGGAVGLSANAIRDQASALEKMSLFEDEAILQGQNLLLTFTNIGKDVFPKATQTMLDMAQALGTDASGSAIQLGKALNDPVKGITALTRVGVTFTAEQKKQIAEMVKAGDVAAAQGVILAELEKEFGGSAKAASDAAGASEKYKDKMNDLKEQIGTKMLPIQQKWMELQVVVIDLLATKLIPVLEELYAKHWPAIQEAIETKVIPAVEAIMPVVKFMAENMIEQIKGAILIWESIIAIVTHVVDTVDALIHGRWQEAWNAAKQIPEEVFNLLEGVFRNALGKLPDLFYDIGKNAVEALGRGISDAAGGVLQKAKDLANSVKDAVKNPLGIFSPSRVFMQMGRDVVKGFEIGLGTATQNLNVPTAAFAQKGLQAVAIGGGGNGGAVNNYYIQGSILAERDIIRLVRNDILNGGLSDLIPNRVST